MRITAPFATMLTLVLAGGRGVRTTAALAPGKVRRNPRLQSPHSPRRRHAGRPRSQRSRRPQSRQPRPSAPQRRARPRATASAVEAMVPRPAAARRFATCASTSPHPPRKESRHRRGLHGVAPVHSATGVEPRFERDGFITLEREMDSPKRGNTTNRGRAQLRPVGAAPGQSRRRPRLRSRRHRLS